MKVFEKAAPEPASKPLLEEDESDVEALSTSICKQATFFASKKYMIVAHIALVSLYTLIFLILTAMPLHRISSSSADKTHLPCEYNSDHGSYWLTDSSASMRSP